MGIGMIMFTLRQPVIIISISAIFGMIGFFYSFLGLIEPAEKTHQFETFRALSIQEIGGHFVFGFIVGLASRNLKISCICGLMAVTIDADHILNALAVNIPARTDHSVLFVGVSSVLMGLFAVKLRNILQTNKILQSKTENENHLKNDDKNLFLQFLFITLAVFLSHIAYDIITDDGAKFPFLIPFSFDEFVVPQIHGLTFEAAGVSVIYLWHKYLVKPVSKEGLNVNHEK